MSTYEENFVFLVIFETCDVVYNYSISLLPPIVLENLFGLHYIDIIAYHPKYLQFLIFFVAKLKMPNRHVGYSDGILCV